MEAELAEGHLQDLANRGDGVSTIAVFNADPLPEVAARARASVSPSSV
jgi:hypothetical protein